jgi:hypothetical protein
VKKTVKRKTKINKTKKSVGPTELGQPASRQPNPAEASPTRGPHRTASSPFLFIFSLLSLTGGTA